MLYEVITPKFTDEALSILKKKKDRRLLKQYADFNGRARRQEYWMFVLFNIIFAIVAGILA